MSIISKLIVISTLGQETIAEHAVNVKLICIKHIENLIYDLYPGMYHPEDYLIYWRYGKTSFFEVYDYFSLYAALFLMFEKVLYVVVRDVYSWNVKFVDRTEAEAVDAVVRDQPGTLRFYTVDFRQRFRMVDALRRGFPKEKPPLQPPSDTTVPVKPMVTKAKDSKKKKDKKDKKKKNKKRGKK